MAAAAGAGGSAGVEPPESGFPFKNIRYGVFQKHPLIGSRSKPGANRKYQILIFTKVPPDRNRDPNQWFFKNN